VSTQRELDELNETYRRTETEDLLRIIQTSRDYRPVAVELARKELATRNLHQEGITVEAVVSQLEKERQKAEEPLGGGLKIVCFFFCGVPGVLIAAFQSAKGRSLASREAWHWIGYGWLARVAFVLSTYIMRA